ncbi:MAG: hypothetical protein ACK5N0_13040 [Synechococcaceae cyanobacterium]
MPAVGLVGLAALAPDHPSASPAVVKLQAADHSFRYLEQADAYVVELDPRRVGFDLFEGWDREEEAFRKRSSLAFVSGPMYERQVDATGSEIVLPLGDIKLGERIWRGRNLSAARERAFVGIRHDGQVDFGYGALTPERIQRYDTFIGGLHSVYNDLQAPPASYKGAYSLGMGQQIRYFLPRIREIYGLRTDGRLEILMSREGLTLEQTRDLARQRGLLAAYLPDHASKSRMIVPGVKGFSHADANWISGGATSFVHVPYMLELVPRREPLRGSLLVALARRLPTRSCGHPLQCAQRLGGQLLDRGLAGVNRLMELGVEPMARLLWAPRPGVAAGSVGTRAPFREPVITADPRVLRLRQQLESQPQPVSQLRATPSPGTGVLPAAPELPPPASASSAEASTGNDSSAGQPGDLDNGAAAGGATATTAADATVDARPSDPTLKPGAQGRGSAEPIPSPAAGPLPVAPPPPGMVGAATP